MNFNQRNLIGIQNHDYKNILYLTPFEDQEKIEKQWKFLNEDDKIESDTNIEKKTLFQKKIDYSDKIRINSPNSENPIL